MVNAATSRQLQTPDGTRMHSREWLPENTPPKVDLLLVHGHGEHVARHAYGAEQFTAAGMRVIGCDLRGHGRSGGQRGHIDSLQQLIADLDLVLKEYCTDCSRPLVAHGHSMGGLLLLHMALANPQLFAAISTTSPWLRLRSAPPRWKQFLADWVGRYFQKLTLSTGLKPSQMAYDSQLELPAEEKNLNHRRISAAMYRELTMAATQALDAAAAITTPLLIIQGDDDPIMDPEAAREFADAAHAATRPVELDILQGKMHEPHNDAGRDTLYQEIAAWLLKHANLQQNS